ncbi:hypothetical protein Amet_4283 [Alkaliphilus metalliredigens QYMF]|uniref:DUF6487 domain-containing protein n=1 Tax=Alkaliphilus metalliredigens (strain QYMF) TaxID=293826 RepID=A6TVZ2_ALKMQ|nr:hypothetical protein Amet_4283 [Alkaliphilus metalliredigens QYMF]
MVLSFRGEINERCGTFFYLTAFLTLNDELDVLHVSQLILIKSRKMEGYFMECPYCHQKMVHGFISGDRYSLKWIEKAKYKPFKNLLL